MVLFFEMISKIIDVPLFLILIFKFMEISKSPRALEVCTGICVIIILRSISGILGLNMITVSIDSYLTHGVVCLTIIFQLEFRRGLEKIGQYFDWREHLTDKNREYENVKAYNKAIEYMSRKKIGALIVIERKTNLEEYIETGIQLNAELSGELLINIFIPNTPLHDGAVIIRNQRVLVSSAYLPLSESRKISKEFGTRHRAALGISEATDALVIIVSEETGSVSIAADNVLLSDLTREDFVTVLKEKLDFKKNGSCYLKTYVDAILLKLKAG